MISTADALTRIFALVSPLAHETVPLRHAAGRTLAQDVYATRDQPPFAASAMDGYAVKSADLAGNAVFNVVGEAAAGHGYSGQIQHGEAARIFTGAPLPSGADHVIIQEDTSRNADIITLAATYDPSSYVRPAGADFKTGDTITAPRLLTPADIALLAAMNIANVPVTRRPVVAIIATGDELVQPGEIPQADQIIASNSYGLAALIEAHGGIARLLPIARDNDPALNLAFDLAQGTDLIVTIGGASVGDHDLVGKVALARGMNRAFYKVAMRPGKPLMAGTIDGIPMIGLPGNPVSAMVCGHIFMLPILRKMLGHPAIAAPRETAALTHNLAQNGPREHYMRARVDARGPHIFARQDSALLTVLADTNCLAVRPPNDGPRLSGDILDIIWL